MNIKILDSWLREYVHTKATPQKIAELLSLSSVSVERLEKYTINSKPDYLYDIEITTNRPDLMAIIGLARETAAVLQQNNIEAKFVKPALTPLKAGRETEKITVKNNPKLVNRICAVVMDISLKPSSEVIKHRLEATDIRSLNNIIDVTNYVMRVTGHPAHVFDYDRLHTKKLLIRESRPGEKIMTLDKKEYTLRGGDIVADDGTGRIVDLLGIMGLENSVVTDETKRILFFIDNNDPHRMRKTSMSLGIRTEAVVLNEKELDPELAYEAFLYGIKLYEELASGKVVSEIIDIYPNKIESKEIKVPQSKITILIGVPVTLKQSETILKRLDFAVKVERDALLVTPPTVRAKDIQIPEDVIEEIARIYGYHNIPDTLPLLAPAEYVNLGDNTFYWEDRVKDAMKYWGFTEVYTYPMVSEELVKGQTEMPVKIANPLSEEFVYMRRTIIPSLVKVANENKDHDEIKIFELGNVFTKKKNDLPEPRLTFTALIKKKQNSFYEVKGLIEQIAADLGIIDLTFESLENGVGANIKLASATKSEEMNGVINILNEQTITFELNLEQLIKHATLRKTYKPVSKYPSIVEDIALIAPGNIKTGEIIDLIKKQNPLITSVSLLDKYEDTKTFHIIYQSYEKNLTSEEVGKIREKILKVLKEKLDVKLKD